MRKILLVTDAWAPQVNGVVRVQNAYLRELTLRGYEVPVIEPGQFRTIRVPPFRDIPVALFPRRKVAQMIEDIRPDAVHLMTEGPLGTAARSVCVERGLPFTSWYHSHFQLYFKARLRALFAPAYAYMRWFHGAAVHTIVSTQTLKDTLLESGFRDNIAIVPLGVDVELFSRNLMPSLPPLPKPVFAYFSRLAPEKNPEEFLKLDLPGTKLVIGDGPSRKELEARYGGRNIFVGYKHGQELVDWLSLADVFVFPSRTETFGLVALEALSCGIPVAAHDVMGPRDIITEGKDGYVGDDLKEAALKCLTLSREDCRAKALRYSWQHSTDAFIKALVPIRGAIV